MPLYRFECDITLHGVYSPGTWLINRDNLYLTVEAFGVVKRTRLHNAIFPLLIHEKFSFEKVFYAALSACNVADRLEDYNVTIELRQIADAYLGGTLLAYYTTNVKELFSPCTQMCLRSLPKNDLMMLKTIDFPGISPRLEYNVSSVIKCHPSTCCYDCCHSAPQCCCFDPCLYKPVTPLPNYHRPTVNSALRCRYPELAVPKSYVSSDAAIHTAKNRTSRSLRREVQPDGSLNLRNASRPRSFSANRRTNVEPVRITRETPLQSLSIWDLRQRTLKDAQDRSDRYWHLYRFWQNEYDRLRLQGV